MDVVLARIDSTCSGVYRIHTGHHDSPSIEIVVEISDKGLYKNAAYTGAAIIVGLAAFGSLVSIVVERGFGSVVLHKKEDLAMYGCPAMAITPKASLKPSDFDKNRTEYVLRLIDYQILLSASILHETTRS